MRRRRYLKTTGDSPNTFCTGDNQNRRGAGATVTTFGLRAPADHQNPRTVAPEPGCTRQYPGYYSRHGSPAEYLEGVRHRLTTPTSPRVFHQWATLCTFTPTAAGDYYLQVRTNVALGGTRSEDVDDGQLQARGRRRAVAMYTQTGDDPAVKGGGSNRFAARAYGRPGRQRLGVAATDGCRSTPTPPAASLDVQPDPGAAGGRRQDDGLQVLRRRRRGRQHRWHGHGASSARGDRRSHQELHGYRLQDASACRRAPSRESATRPRPSWNGTVRDDQRADPVELHRATTTARAAAGSGSRSRSEAARPSTTRPPGRRTISGDPVRLIE